MAIDPGGQRLLFSTEKEEVKGSRFSKPLYPPSCTSHLWEVPSHHCLTTHTADGLSSAQGWRGHP